MSEKEYVIEKISEINWEDEIRSALHSRKIPLKLCYPGDGAHRWDLLRGCGGQEHNSEFELGKRECAGLHRLLSRLPAQKDPMNIIHVGIGNGIELAALISSFDFKRHFFWGVDISIEMIHNVIFEDIAENYVSDSYETDMSDELINRGMELIEDLENRLTGGIEAIFRSWYKDNFGEDL